MNTLQDAVNPKHYKSHPSGIECIEIRRHLPSNRSDAIKYLWRLGQKDASEQELKKAIWYLNDEANYFGGTVEYKETVKAILQQKMDVLAMYQSDVERRLFNYIVFGGENALRLAIQIIEEML